MRALDDDERARGSVDQALTTVQRIVGQLLTSTHGNGFAAGSPSAPTHEHDSLEPRPSA